MATTWAGENYKRKRSGDFRNRRTGAVQGNVRVRKRKGKRNQAIIFDGKNFKGVEITGRHFFGSDPRPSKSGKRDFEMSVAQRKAMFAKKGKKR
jgi:hypothetical protein|tara:strand:- start:6749 stop:7030 length:282 start_codon:yes stop_codon:yes gene_type:complete